ncbi:MAG TPA: PaaI family thioesterase [Aggregatilineaceae bacterium]|nr:PaaI family thioesterase [Aggregatilineaceae bacterium]
MTDSQQTVGRCDQQPNSRWCFVCGIENPCGLKIRFHNDGYHRSLARVTLGEQYQSYPGIVHGGILTTILDETMGRAILAEDGSDDISQARFMFTVKMETRFRKSVPLNEEFIVRGRVEQDRGRMVQVSGEVVLGDGMVAVEASATLVTIPPEQVDQMLSYDVGWKVYP